MVRIFVSDSHLSGERFPLDFLFQLAPTEKAEVVANCDHLQKLKFSKVLASAQAGGQDGQARCFRSKAREEGDVARQPLS